MEQIRSRQAIREEGAQAAHEGKQGSSNPHAEGTEAREEWDRGFILAHRSAHAHAMARAAA
jgi:hypothetical protein